MENSKDKKVPTALGGKPAKKELVDMLRKVAHKLNEHQHKDKRIAAGFTLAANVDGMTEILNEITTLLIRNTTIK